MTIIIKLSSQIGDKTEEGNRQAAMDCLKNPSLLIEIGEGLISKEAAIVGDCAEVFTKVAEKQPELILAFANDLLNLLSHKTTRVRWEAMHAIALITAYIPSEISKALPQLTELIKSDKSTIVRDYAIESLCNYATVGESEAQTAFPLLKESLLVWEGKHRARVLKGFLHVCHSTDKYTLEIRGIAEEYEDDPKGVVKKAARSLIKAIDKGIV
ncbi:HEAT repeat domain-containing protein [Bacillus sp. JJ1532]|uniref:HEAT repeat domain-containing protein n=1 Tax=Bacillus sp. JJ1532 TaxID=3122958 RepID=UPI002FFEF5DA